MKRIYFSFCNYYFLQNSNFNENYLSRNLNQLVEEIYNKKPCELSWEILYLTASNKLTKQFEKTKGIRMLLSLFLFMAETGEYSGNDIKQLLENRENIKRLIQVNAENYLKFFLLKNTCPNSVICWSDSRTIRATVIDSKNQFLLFLFREYISKTNLKCGGKISSCYKVFSYFELAIFPIEIESINEINDTVFFTCLKKMHEWAVKDREIIRFISFFQWIVSISPTEVLENNFKLINTVSLSYFYLSKCIFEGYILVKYSVYEKPKYHEKMLLIPSSDEEHIKGESFRIYPFNISEIKNLTLRKWYTDFFWNGTNLALRARTKELSLLRKLLIEIDTRVGNQNEDIIISGRDIVSYISSAKKIMKSNAKTATNLSQLKKFLGYIEQEYGCEVNPLYFHMLVYKDDPPNAYKEAFTKEEINRITDYFATRNPLIQIAINLLSQTELRAESVLSLKITCLKKTLSRVDKNEYALSVHTKRSDNEVELVNINMYVKTHIEEAIMLTKEIRENSNSYDKEYLFIYLPQGRSAPRRFKPDSLTLAINKACQELEIVSKGSRGFRNYYMQTVSNFLSDNDYNHSYTEVLTGHTNSKHVSNYDKIDILKFVEKYYFVNIGDVYFSGSIKKNSNLSKEASVVDNCGFCSNKHCDKEGMLDCFMCKYFVTTIACIPFYESEIEKLDKKIIEEKLSHEKDFVLSKKKLLVGYLTQLLILKGGEITHD